MVIVQRFILFLALMLAFSACKRTPLANNSGSSPTTPTAAIAVGKAAPEIEGEDLDGVSFKLSDYQGKIVMLDFWGDW